MKPWIKICAIFSIAYMLFSALIYKLSTEKAAVLGILAICLAFNIGLFLKYRKKPERIHFRGEIVRIKSPIVELYEKIKNTMGVKK